MSSHEIGPAIKREDYGLETRTLQAAASKKIIRRLLPFMMVLFFINQTDRVNVAFASLVMNKELGLTPEVYGFGAGVFFIGYFLFEVPSNLIMHRVGARLWMCRIMVTWGVISTVMACTYSPTSFYVLRFLLGLAEAGFLPGHVSVPELLDTPSS